MEHSTILQFVDGLKNPVTHAEHTLGELQERQFAIEQTGTLQFVDGLENP